jgi:hypothetical protein
MEDRNQIPVGDEPYIPISGGVASIGKKCFFSDPVVTAAHMEGGMEMSVEYDYVYRTDVIDGRTYRSRARRQRLVEGFSYYYRPPSDLPTVAADDTSKRQQAAAGGVRGVPQGFRRRGQAQGHAMRPRLPRPVHLPVAPP